MAHLELDEQEAVILRAVLNQAVNDMGKIKTDLLEIFGTQMDLGAIFFNLNGLRVKVRNLKED